MQATLSSALIVGLVAAFAFSGSPSKAYEQNRCTKAPRAEWKSIGQARAALKAKGYRVDSIDRDSRCFEAEVRNRSGQRFEIYVDPVTLRFVKVERAS